MDTSHYKNTTAHCFGMCTTCALFLGQLLHAPSLALRPALADSDIAPRQCLVRNLLSMILPHTPDACRSHIALAAFLPCLCQHLFHPCHCLYFVSHSFALAIETLCHHSVPPQFSLACTWRSHNLNCPYLCLWRACRFMPPKLARTASSSLCQARLACLKTLANTCSHDNVSRPLSRMIVLLPHRPTARPSRPNPCHSRATSN